MPQDSDILAAGALNGLGATATVQAAGRQSLGVSLAAGLVGTVTPQFSYDGGVTYWTDLTTPPIILGLASTAVSGVLPIPAGATHAQLRVSAYTSGSSAAALRATASPSSTRMAATGPLAAATATVITAGREQSVTGNFVAIPVDPSKWGTVVFTFTASAFSGTLTWDVMINGQWYTVGLVSATQPVVGTPYATLVSSTGSGSPTVAGSVVYTTTAADTWELPLPGNATQVRVRCSAFTSGSVTVTLAPGKPYVPGTLAATLYDITSGTNTALDSGTVELAGWSRASVSVVGSGASNGVLTINEVDDAGASLATFGGGGGTITGTTPIAVIYSDGTNAAASNLGSSNYGYGYLPKRLRLQSGAVAAQTSRLRCAVRR